MKSHNTQAPAGKRLIMHNLFWAVLGKVVTLMGSLFVGIIVARYLGPEQYGLMNYVVSYVTLYQTLALFGLDNIEVREEAKGETPYTTIIGTAFGLKLMLGVATVVLAIATSFLMEADIRTTGLVAIYSLSIIANSSTVIRNYFTAIVQNEYVVKSEIARTLLGMTIKIVLLLNSAPLIWFVVAVMFDYVLLSIGYALAYHSKVGSMRKWTFKSHYAVYMLKESFPLVLTSAAVIIYQRIDQVMIGQMIDKEAVGYFSVAGRFVEILIYIPYILSDTILPVLVRHRTVSVDAYKQHAQLFMNITVWTTLLTGLVMSLVSWWAVRLLFGTAYMPAVPVLQVLAFKAATVALSTTAGRMLIIEGLQRWAILRDLLGCVVCVGLNIIVLPRYGIVGSAFVAIASNLVAGYFADALIPAYRHLFRQQSLALLLGWRDLFHIRRLLPSKAKM